MQVKDNSLAATSAAVDGACDGSITEAQAQMLLGQVQHEPLLRVELCQQILVDRVLKGVLRPAMDTAALLAALPRPDLPLQARVLGDARLQAGSRGRTRRRPWGAGPVAPGLWVAAAAAALISIYPLNAIYQRLRHTSTTIVSPPQSPIAGATSPDAGAAWAAGHAGPPPPGMPAALAATAQIPIDTSVTQLEGLIRRRVVMRETFEHRTAGAAAWKMGAVAPCPPGSRGRRCLRSTRMGTRHPDQFGATLGNWRDRLFDHDDALFVSFDYWVGDTTGPAPHITLAIHGDEERTYRLDFPTARKAAWVHVVAPLARARYWHDPERKLTPGEGIRALHFTIDWSDDDVFFLENVEVSAYARP